MDTLVQQSTSLKPELDESIQDSERPSLQAGFFERTREKITDYATYTNLKIREYFGKINEAQLDTLLNFEFEQELKDNPPLTREFNAKVELEQIRKLPKEKKKAALDELKSNLAIQREAWATYYGFMQRQIQVNSKAGGRLSTWLTRFQEQYNFSSEDMDKAVNMIDAFNSNQAKMKEFRAQHPDDLDLVQSLTGATFKPNTKFDIKIGAFSIQIYADTLSANRIWEHFHGLSYSDKPLRYRAFANPFGEIKYTVLKNKNVWGKSNSREIQIINHEEQHVINRNFMESMLKILETRIQRRKQFEDETNIEMKSLLLENFVYDELDFALLRVKDEIIAMKRDDSGYNYTSIFAPNGSHDYLDPVRELLKKQNLYSDKVKEILESDYSRLIKNAATIFDSLKTQGKFTKDETIALLIDQSLLRWPRMARRLLEAKQKQKS